MDNRLVTACIVKTATGVQCQCFTFGKSTAMCVFVRFPSTFFFCVRHNQLGYLTFRTNKVIDTKLVLAGSYSILSKIKQLFKNL